MPNPITVGRFKEEFIARTNFASRRNVRSAVHILQERTGLSDVRPLGELFSITARQSLEAFFEQRKTEVARTTHASQESIQRQFIRNASRALGIDKPQSFADELRAQMLLQGERPATLYRRAKVCRESLNRWLRGEAHPRDWHGVERLEDALRLPRGHLIDCVHPIFRRPPEQRQLTEFQRTQAALTRDRFHLKQLPSDIERVVKEIIEFRTARVAPFGLKRDRNNVWRINEDGCPSAQIFEDVVRAFYGFLANRDGMPLATLSLKQLFDPDLWARFMDFIGERSQHRGKACSIKIGVLPPLFKARTGFFWQQPKYSRFVQRRMSMERWQRHCEELAAHFSDVKRDLEADRPKGRDPRVDLRLILEQKDPLSVLRLLLERMLRAKPAYDRGGHPGLAQARWARDCLLVRFLNWMPLRNRNWRIMTYRTDNSAHLYQRSDGSWWLRFAPREFKPKKRKQGPSGDFDVRISETLWEPIAEYLTLYRPLFSAAAQGDVVFCSSLPRRSRSNAAGRFSAQALALLMLNTTRRFLPEYPGFSTHAWRHIITTAWLTEHPDQWPVAAHFLNDSWGMVREWYAHLQVQGVLEGFTAQHDRVVNANTDAFLDQMRP